ncbi:hypothetical protein D3C86_1156040 [compost metagenome]
MMYPLGNDDAKFGQQSPSFIGLRSALLDEPLAMRIPAKLNSHFGQREHPYP